MLNKDSVISAPYPIYARFDTIKMVGQIEYDANVGIYRPTVRVYLDRKALEQEREDVVFLKVVWYNDGNTEVLSNMKSPYYAMNKLMSEMYKLKEILERELHDYNPKTL